MKRKNTGQGKIGRKIFFIPFEKDLIECISEIHSESLPDDFLPSLGPDFLENIFYPAVLKSKFADTIIAAIGETPIGFTVVSMNNNSLLLDILKYKPFDFVKSILRFLFSSKENFLFVVSLFFSMFAKGYHQSEFGEIYIIAVKKKFRGFGIGNELVQKSMDSIFQKNKGGIKIKTLATNKAWIEHFLNRGWIKKGENRIHKKIYVTLIYEF